MILINLISTCCQGFEISVNCNLEIELKLSNGFGADFTFASLMERPESVWDGNWHQVCFILEGGAKVALCVVDGELCDGGSHPQGWSSFSNELGEISGCDVHLLPDHTNLDGRKFNGQVLEFAEYHRPLLVSEAIASWRAGPTEVPQLARSKM